MKKVLYPLFTLILISTFNATSQYSWSQANDFGGSGREGAVCFVTDSYVFAGLGSDSSGYRKDFWKYDPSSDTWTQVADFGGDARSYAVAFTINGKGYVGTGQSGSYGSYVQYNDLWEYDPTLNTWTKKTDFPASARYSAIGFSINGKGYIGTGKDAVSEKKDFWEYNPTANLWTQKADLPQVRQGSSGFAINDKGYICCGIYINNGSFMTNDLYEYDPTGNTWKQKTFGEIQLGRYGATTFVLNSKAYLGGGQGDKDAWVYDPSNNNWSDISDFGPANESGRAYPIGFAINGKGYIGLGSYYSGGLKLKKDIWVYSLPSPPNKPLNLTVVSSNLSQVTISWVDNSKDETGFIIERSKEDTLHFIKVDSVGSNLTTFTNTGLEEATAYYYRVKSKNDYFYSANSNIIEAETLGQDPPSAPGNLSATAQSSKKILLNWSDNSANELFFVIERSKENNTDYKVIDTTEINATSFIDSELTDSTRYYYRIRAKNKSGYSAYSNEVSSVTFALHLPAAPENLKVEFSERNLIKISWLDNSYNETEFLVEVSRYNNQNFIPYETTTANTNRSYFADLEDTTLFYFRVRAYNDDGYSDYSNEIAAYTLAGWATDHTASTSSAKSVKLMWQDNSIKESAFIVERSDNNENNFKVIDTLINEFKQNYYIDYKVDTGITYYYRVATIIKGNKKYTNTCSLKTTESGNWVVPQPEYRFDYVNNVALYNKKLYFITTNSKFVQFDPQTSQWILLEYFPDSAREMSSQFLINNKIYNFHGLASHGRTTNWEYDLNNNIWSKKKDAPMPDYVFTLTFSVGKKGYMMGGGKYYTTEGGYGIYYDTTKVWEYDSEADTWERLADFPLKYMNSGGSSVINNGNEVYLFSYDKQVWKFDTVSKNWNFEKNMNVDFDPHAVCYFNGKYYFIKPNINYTCKIVEFNLEKNIVQKEIIIPGIYTNEYTFLLSDKNAIYVGDNHYMHNIMLYYPDAPTPPANVSVAGLNKSEAKLTWIDNTNLETKYYIERNNVIIDSVAANVESYIDKGLTESEFTYRVIASNNINRSYSVYTTLKNSLPQAPVFNSTLSAIYSDSIKLEWFGYDNTLGFIVERKEGTGNFIFIDSLNTNNFRYSEYDYTSKIFTFTDKGIEKSHLYTYRIKAVNHFGSTETTAKVIGGSLYLCTDTVDISDEAYFFDEYGFDVPYYSRFKDFTLTLKPARPGEKVYITFYDFNICDEDNINIHDGSSSESPLIVYSPSNIRPNSVFYSSNSEGALTIKFYELFGGNCGDGWYAKINCAGIIPPSELSVEKDYSCYRLYWIDNSNNETAFLIERSKDSLNFNVIDTAYWTSYSDCNIEDNVKYFYRIKAIKEDLSSAYSNIAWDNNLNGLQQNIVNNSITVYPNPTPGIIKMKINSYKSRYAALTLINSAGQTLRNINLLNNKLPEIYIDIQSEPDGLYFLKIQTTEESIVKCIIKKTR